MKRLLWHHLPPAVVIAIIANGLGLIVIGFLGLGWYERQRYEREHEEPFLSYLNSPFPTLETVITAGEPITLVVRRQSTAPERRLYRVAANLVSDSDPNLLPTMLGSVSAMVDPGTSEWYSTVNRTSIGTPYGTYHIEGIAEVQGVYHTFSIPWSSQSFKVTPPPFAR